MLIVYLHGAGGSLDDFNLAREPVYAPLRADIAARGWTLLVPYLGGRHFMSNEGQRRLDAVIDQVLIDRGIPPSRVHLLGTSMGGGSSLAYVVRRPGRVRSVCAIMPMTDFSLFARENQTYGDQMATAYGATVEDDDSTYRLNSAVLHADAFAETPVMLFHGMDDTTVDPGHSRRLADRLRGLGYACHYYPVSGHQHDSIIISGRQHEVVAFFDAAMKPAAATPARESSS